MSGINMTQHYEKWRNINIYPEDLFECVNWNAYLQWFPNYLTNVVLHICCFWGVIDCLDLYSMFKHSSVSLICSYRFSPTRWGSMAEWHGEKNLQVSRAHSWGFMARFTPSAALQAGGGFVNPLLNGDAKGARFVPLVGEICVEQIQRAALLTSALHQEVAHLPSAQGN